MKAIKLLCHSRFVAAEKNEQRESYRIDKIVLNTVARPVHALLEHPQFISSPASKICYSLPLERFRFRLWTPCKRLCATLYIESIGYKIHGYYD